MLNNKGQCCGSKPIVYKRWGILFCHRCDREYDLYTKEQRENFAWTKKDEVFVVKFPERKADG